MCGRFTLTASSELVQAAFNLTSVPAQMIPRYNIAPSQPVAVVTNEDPYALTFHRWGLVPSWAKDVSVGYKMINARSETVHEKPSFKAALKRRRCLIPADGFFEWKVDGKGKTPHYIHLRDKSVFAFAGLWEIWRSSDGDELRTCTILTTEANAFMKSLHERMPVILRPDDYATWLQPGEVLIEELKPLMRQYDPALMAEYEVSPLVNKPGNDMPDVIEPVG